MRYSKKIEDRIADIGQIVLGMEFKKLLLLYLLIINFTSRKTHFKGYKSGLGNFIYLATICNSMIIEMYNDMF